MGRSLSSALIYALIVFAIGFVLGSLRNIFLAPLFGAYTAVLIELPVILLACWYVARWVIRHKQVPPRAVLRLSMGFVALAILTGLEALTAMLLFGLPPWAFLSGYLTLQALPGLIGQLLFAAFPVLLLLVRR